MAISVEDSNMYVVDKVKNKFLQRTEDITHMHKLTTCTHKTHNKHTQTHNVHAQTHNITHNMQKQPHTFLLAKNKNDNFT